LAPGAQQLLRREAAMYDLLQGAQGLAIPRLVGHGPGVGGRGYFLATELVDGRPLNRGGEDQAVCDAALAALRVVHAAGVAHGDLRASNIVVQGSRVWLIDFTHAEADADGDTLVWEEQLLLELLAPARGAAGSSRANTL
jgi:tRNA A-37 threonylcarbamoyl transferase component Bud32